MSASPSATIAYSTPDSNPEMTTCPIIAGVMTTFIARATTVGRGAKPPSELPGRPGWCREELLALREVIGPDDHLLLLLPLEDDRLVGDLEAVLVDLVVAEGGLHLQLQELLAHLVRVEASRALDRLGVDVASRVPGRGR